MYQDIIKRVCLNLSIEADPRHIEGFMRLQYGTLDHLTREEFAKECKLFDKIKEQDDWEANAQSFGLWTLNRVSCSPRAGRIVQESWRLTEPKQNKNMISKTQIAIASTIFFVAVYATHTVGLDNIVRRIISTVFTDL